MILKIAATIAVICGASAYFMVKLDEANFSRYSDNHRWYSIVGGIFVIVTIIAVLVTAITAIWTV